MSSSVSGVKEGITAAQAELEHGQGLENSPRWAELERVRFIFNYIFVEIFQVVDMSSSVSGVKEGITAAQAELEHGQVSPLFWQSVRE